MLALVAYREVSQLKTSVRNAHYPNVIAVVRKECQGNAAHDYAAACVKPAYDYFLTNFDANSGEFSNSLQAFKAARYLSPVLLSELRPSPNNVDVMNSSHLFCSSN